MDGFTVSRVAHSSPPAITRVMECTATEINVVVGVDPATAELYSFVAAEFMAYRAARRGGGPHAAELRIHPSGVLVNPVGHARAFSDDTEVMVVAVFESAARDCSFLLTMERAGGRPPSVGIYAAHSPGPAPPCLDVSNAALVGDLNRHVDRLVGLAGDAIQRQIHPNVWSAMRLSQPFLRGGGGGNPPPPRSSRQRGRSRVRFNLVPDARSPPGSPPPPPSGLRPPPALAECHATVRRFVADVEQAARTARRTPARVVEERLPDNAVSDRIIARYMCIDGGLSPVERVARINAAWQFFHTLPPSPEYSREAVEAVHDRFRRFVWKQETNAAPTPR